MEEYVEHMDEVCDLGPYQRLYKWDNATDVSCFEPEWGASKLLVEYFAQKPDKYLEIYAGKSDNVDNLLSLDHKGKTIIQWSIAARTQSTVIEQETAPWDRRVGAARKCQEAGYIVRYRFSPIIPVKGWKEENAELIALIFERTRPDVISLCPFGWMSFEDAKACLDLSLLDPQYVAAMESAAPFLAARGFTSGGGRPIPHDARAYMIKSLIDEIRKHSKTIPIALCLETVEMWALFERELGMPMNPEKHSSYYCNCGPMCTPENPYSKGVTPGPSWFE
jgi:spore photoproduct lyase